MTKRIGREKRIHEAKRYLQRQLALLFRYDAIILKVSSITTEISPQGVGSFCIPSPDTFERISPTSIPQGIVFTDGSFLIVKEIFSYQYPSQDASKAEICRIEYSYHYQRPQENSFFRYDFHPEIGEPKTHPIYHLHAFGWPGDATKLPSVPRFAVSQITLEEILDLIRRDFFT